MANPTRRTHLLLSALAGLGLVGCTEEKSLPPPVPEPPATVDELAPPTARWQQVQELSADLEAPRHISDGGGSARLVGEAPVVTSGMSGRWTIEYTTGSEGIAVGGSIVFLPEPFWGWSAPQTVAPDAPGFTSVTTDAEGVELVADTLQRAMLRVVVEGRALTDGETVRIDYGAGPAGARSDRHSERGAHLWIGVDGDGDGVRKMLVDSPTVEIAPGAPERVVAHATSRVGIGESVRMTVAVLDAMASVTRAECELRVSDPSGLWDLDEILTLGGNGAEAALTIELAGAPEGLHRLEVRGTVAGRELATTTHPIHVGGRAPRVLWADLHGHSNFSDGTGLPEDFFRYARDVAGLDAVALTDHDHFGVLFMDQHPHMWDEVRRCVAEYHEPGRFVAILGYEWTSWIHGHRHVLYFEDEGEVLSSLDPAYETPRQLWDALRGKPALTFAHHSAGSPIPTNWTFAPDPELEPVTEVMSVHGSSEAADSPLRLRGGLRGNFVRDVLDRGVRFGFIGSGDSHDGHPGLAHLSPVYGFRDDSRRGTIVGTGGLAAILTEEHTREGILEALRNRRVYATSGPRILLATLLDGHGMGSVVKASDLSATAIFALEVAGTGPIESIDIVRSGAILTRLNPSGAANFAGAIGIENGQPGEYVYARVVQTDQSIAWSSPIYIGED